MATSYAVYPSSPSHFMRSPESSFCGGDWVGSPNLQMPGSPQALTSTATPRRPKLSLNTTCSRSLGRTSGLRLDTLTAMSPTVRNTYANGFEDAQPRMVLPRSTGEQSSRFEDCVSADESSATDLPKTPSLVSNSDIGETASNVVIEMLSQRRAIPYAHPSNLRSILANSPLLQHSLIKRSTLITQASLSMDATIPARKRKNVCFAEPLIEEIKSETYIVRQSDTPSRTPSPAPSHSIVTASVDVAVTSSSSTSVIYHGESKPARTLKFSRKREEVDEEDSHVIPQTPVGGRRKRQRDWVWTLGPMEQDDTHCDPQPLDDEVTTVEDLSTQCPTNVSNVSVTSQVFDALKPATMICDAVKDLASSNGLVTSIREVVDGYFGLSN